MPVSVLDCAKRYDDRAQILAGTYGGDANILAEALCSEDAAEQHRARQTILRVNHAQFSLMDHMGACMVAGVTPIECSLSCRDLLMLFRGFSSWCVKQPPNLESTCNDKYDSDCT